MQPPPIWPATDEVWRLHREEVRKARGAACFGALAEFFGTESPARLEALVDGREAYLTQGGDRAWSGKYRRWWRNGRLPSDQTVRRVLQGTGGAVDLRRWRNSMLWDLAVMGPPTMMVLSDPVNKLSPRAREVLFSADQRQSSERPSEIDRQRILNLRDEGTLDAFLALLCLARRCEILHDTDRHALFSACTFDVFPRVLHQHAPLRYRWEGLYGCLERICWSKVHSRRVREEFGAERIRSNLAALQASPEARIELIAETSV